jgi:hypothetical protein
MCILYSTSMMSSTIVAATTMDMTEKIGITLPKSIQLVDTENRPKAWGYP